MTRRISLAVTMAVSAAVVGLASHAGTGAYNDMGSFSGVKDDFWDTTGHARVPISFSESQLQQTFVSADNPRQTPSMTLESFESPIGSLFYAVPDFDFYTSQLGFLLFLR